VILRLEHPDKSGRSFGSNPTCNILQVVQILQSQVVFCPFIKILKDALGR
jgi:hypothetical protein